MKTTGVRAAAGAIVIVLLTVAVAPPGPARAAPDAGPDLSTPQAALAAVRKALDKGDAAALAAATVGDARLMAWARAEAGQWRALNELDATLARRFGDAYTKGEAGKDIKETIDGIRDEDLRTDLKSAKPGEVHGDAVVLAVNETDPDDLQPRLVRAGGAWRLDLDSLTNYIELRDTPVYLAVARAAAALTRDVAAGKFEKLEDAAEAVDDRLTAAERDAVAEPAPDKGAVPATRPGTP